MKKILKKKLAKVEGAPRKTRLDKKNFIQAAIKHPGALHEDLGVPKGEKIPAVKLEKATHSSDPTIRKRANFAKTLQKLN